MTVHGTTFEAAVDDLRALMDEVIAGDFRELRITDSGTEIFISRDVGAVDPLRLPAHAHATLGSDRSVSTRTGEVTAPHVCTLASLSLGVGDVLTANTTIGTIAVLDKPIDLVATSGGEILEVLASPGQLLEYGDLILRFAEVGE